MGREAAVGPASGLPAVWIEDRAASTRPTNGRPTNGQPIGG
jgi:hypothetical protein